MTNPFLEFVADGDEMSSRRSMELLWADAVSHLPQTNGQVFLPRNVVEDMIEKNHLEDMALRLASIHNKRVQIVLDESMDAYRLFPKELNAERDEDLVSDQHVIELNEHVMLTNSIFNADDLKIPVRPAKIPRPPNCFILYRQANHHLVKNANPGLSNNEISRILGARWNNETPEVRHQFTRLANDLKREHAIKHPDYQYAPRRPEDRRRRTRPRAAAAIAAMESDPTEEFDENLIPIDDEFMSTLSDTDMLFGPNGAEPIPAPWPYYDRMEISNELASGKRFKSMEYIPMPFDSDESSLPMPSVF
ncbi:High mobility group, superfamily [Penicillium griseofulvum]|uniref:High mobility group, superfamily n=1 Tax=Penicillium patulum TaxID=5078 RepID=A0A135L9V9_PENPA|nr:High mobility group, superfamily [Penicillium griseofulvum]KXG45749.1 High mobility group, superfamily [Penicillium griseofulvum]